MVEGNRYCLDVATQINALDSAAGEVEMANLLRQMLRHQAGYPGISCRAGGANT